VSGRSGATLMPQLPPITVVTPCETLNAMSGCDSSAWSSCVWQSMKPGRDDQPAGVDAVRGAAAGQVADGHDAAGATPTSASKRVPHGCRR
jgi:hypothetical protein